MIDALISETQLTSPLSIAPNKHHPSVEEKRLQKELMQKQTLLGTVKQIDGLITTLADSGVELVHFSGMKRGENYVHLGGKADTYEMHSTPQRFEAVGPDNMPVILELSYRPTPPPNTEVRPENEFDSIGGDCTVTVFSGTGENIQPDYQVLFSFEPDGETLQKCTSDQVGENGMTMLVGYHSKKRILEGDARDAKFAENVFGFDKGIKMERTDIAGKNALAKATQVTTLLHGAKRIEIPKTTPVPST